MSGIRKAVDRLLDRKAQRVPKTVLTLDERMGAVRRWGDFSLAYSTAVQDGLSHFGSPDGYVAFSSKMGTVIALADPVASAEAAPALIDAFVAAAGTPCFAEITRPTADLLARKGYRIAHMGVDTALDLASFDFSGKRKETVRYSERWLEKNGYRMVEADELPGAEEGIRALSKAWRAQRIVKGREMAFLNRPFPKEPDPNQRRFLLVHPEGRIESLLYFDPIFRNGETVGYLTAFKRKRPEATSHAEIGLTKRATDIFKAEGRERVMLGLSPVAGMAPSGYAESAAFRSLMERLYDADVVNRRIFNLKGHAAFKRRFHGREEPRYFAWKSGIPVWQFISLLRLSKAF